MTKTNWILYAVDGTDSKVWRPKNKGYSHTYDFYKRFCQANYYSKVFFEGPSFVGNECDEMVTNGLTYILRNIKDNVKNEVILIGHSRGAAIVACIAELLYKNFNRKTYFIGLYDAVDRTTEFEAPEDISHYCKYVYHAIRHPSWKSREIMGNCCISSCINKKYFLTSHGGVGGDPSIDYSLEGYLIGDHSNIKFDKPILSSFEASDKGRFGPAYDLHLKQLQQYETKRKERYMKAVSGSKLAHSWMLSNARKAGINV